MSDSVADVFWAEFVTPPMWRTLGRWGPTGQMYAHNKTVFLKAILSVDPIGSQHWLHLSLSAPDRLPSYDDLVRAKEDFLRPDVRAIQIFPPRSEHVNLHPNCLHLWAELFQQDGLPDFRPYV